jgi:hypothetical protein
VEYLCENLKLTISKDRHLIEPNTDEITVTLTDDLTLAEVKVCYPINNVGEGHLDSWKYHVREALIISVRRVLSEAWAQGMIQYGSFSNFPGASTMLNIPDRPSLVRKSATGFKTELDV